MTIVEPSPPADPLGRRIAALYSRAKREAGLFEQYQPLEYWRKLLAMVKADVYQSLFTFTRVPPKHQVAETVALVLQAMAIEEMPKEYLDELRTLAARPDAQLLPLSRIVLIGTAADDPPPQGAPTKFRPGIDLAPPPPRPTEPLAIASPAPPPRPVTPPAQPQPRLRLRLQQRARTARAPAAAATAGREAGPAQAPLAAPRPPSPPQAAPPEAATPPFGAPFALPEDETPFGGGDTAARRSRLRLGLGAARGRAAELAASAPEAAELGDLVRTAPAPGAARAVPARAGSRRARPASGRPAGRPARPRSRAGALASAPASAASTGSSLGPPPGP